MRCTDSKKTIVRGSPRQSRSLFAARSVSIWRQEALEAKAIGRQPGGRQRRSDSARPGYRRYRDAVRRARPARDDSRDR